MKTNSVPFSRLIYQCIQVARHACFWVVCSLQPYLGEPHADVDAVGGRCDHRCGHFLFVVAEVLLLEGQQQSHAWDVSVNTGQVDGLEG